MHLPQLSGNGWLHAWLYLMVAAGIVTGIGSGFFKARKIQPNGFKWAILRHEVLFATITIFVTAAILGFLNKQLIAHGIIRFRHTPARWWMLAIEYIAYFFLFDTWFYWLHRWMHNEPIYRWVHKLHHKSTSPNLLTTLSVSPIESVINGGFVPLFLSLFSVHDVVVGLIVQTNIVMGLYVHSGYEFLPRWWNRSRASKWFISATFHDQHHRYFTGNFGGYTTIWDRICGTMRPRFEDDFLKVKDRLRGADVPQGAPAT